MIKEDRESLTRSALAKRAGIGIETIRFYEKKGLLLPDFRDGANYRRYREGAVARARLIRSGRELGFSLAEIASLLDLFDLEENPCPAARERTRKKIALIDRKIAELGQIKSELETLVETCERDEASGRCAIRERLENSAPLQENAKPVTNQERNEPCRATDT